MVQLDDAHEVLAALVVGSGKLPGQQGYYRALAGMLTASQGAFERAASRMSNGAQRLLKSAEVRKLIDVPRLSFESMMREKGARRARNFPKEKDNQPEYDRLSGPKQE